MEHGHGNKTCFPCDTEWDKLSLLESTMQNGIN